MPDRLDRLEERLEDLARTLDDAMRRLHAVEKGKTGPDIPQAPSLPAPPPPTQTAGEAPEGSENAAPLPHAGTGPGLATLCGRALLVLAGAFLLRALTEAGTFSRPLGVALGLAYAALWLWPAHRVGLRRWRLDASFHAATAGVVGFPILWEGSDRFGALGPSSGALVLAGLTALLLAIAWRHGLRALALLASLASMVTAISLVWLTHRAAPAGTVLVLTTAAAFLVSDARGWPELRWTTALLADGALLVCGLLVGTPHHPWLPAVPVAVGQLVVFAFFLGAFTWRLAVWHRPAGAFSVIQGLAALVVGLDGAVHTLGETGAASHALAAAALVLGLAAFAHVLARRDPAEGAAFETAYFWSLGILLSVEGSRLLTAAGTCSVAWAALALATAFFASRKTRRALRADAAFLLLLAAFGSGVAPFTFGSLAGTQTESVTAPAMIVLGLVLGCYLVLRWRAGSDAAGVAALSWTVPAYLMVVVGAWGLGALLVRLVAPHVTAISGGATDWGALAALRTAVLVLTALACAALGPGRARRELVWATYTTLVLTGAKILFEDLPRGRPATLFVTLALFGGALIVAPRLLRRTAEAPPSAGAPG